MASSIEVKKLIRINILCFVIFGIIATTIYEQHSVMNEPEAIMADLLKRLGEGSRVNKTIEINANLAEALLTALVRSSILYVYLVLILYYVILIEAEDLISRPIAIIGKFMVFLTIIAYIIAEFYMTTDDMYIVIARLSIVLFALSAFQIVHLCYSVYNAAAVYSFPNATFKYFNKLKDLVLNKRQPEVTKMIQKDIEEEII